MSSKGTVKATALIKNVYLAKNGEAFLQDRVSQFLSANFGNKSWCPVASALGGRNKVQENIHISCLVASVPGSQRLGGLPGKTQPCPAWGVRRRNVFLPNRNFIRFHPLRGTRSAEEELPWLSAAVGSGIAFCSGPKCWIAGKLSVAVSEKHHPLRAPSAGR